MMLRTILWMTATIVIAIGAIAIGDDRFEEAQAQTACTAPASHQLENTLFTADDFDAVMLSHRRGIGPSSRLAGGL
jgi:hypothetical protein